MVAFANASGRRILIGVNDDGRTEILELPEVALREALENAGAAAIH